MAIRMLAVGLCLAAVCLQLTQGANWALIVAGSSGYYNYRHQADICHAYHILRNHGIPQENIVTMMYDDIAYNEENPFKGNIINQPAGPNVYPGVVIDYKKEDVTPEVFLAVLSGDQKTVKHLTGKDGKVIKSGPNDHVFVNFADHGAPGLLAFPDDTLYARQLMSTVKKMYQKKSYKRLVFYVEACESGSMFHKLLPDNINVFASTAASPSQSSYACYFDDKRDTYLGDVYSVNWMQDSDKEDLKTETLQKQYLITKKETNTSHVEEYGNMTITKMTVAEFQGDQTADASMTPSTPVQHLTHDAVPAREVILNILIRKLGKAGSPEEKRALVLEIKNLRERNKQIDQLFKAIMGQVQLAENNDGKVLRFSRNVLYWDMKTDRQDISQWECYEQAVDTLKGSCSCLKLPQDYYALGQLYMLVNLCERGTPVEVVTSAVKLAAYGNPKLCSDA